MLNVRNFFPTCVILFDVFWDRMHEWLVSDQVKPVCIYYIAKFGR